MGKKQDRQSSPRSPGWLLLTSVLSAGVPAALLVVLGRRGFDFSGLLVLVLLAVTALDALLLLVVGLAASRSARLPRAPDRQYPSAGAVVLAVSGSSPTSVSETVDALLRMPYLSPVQIVVACGSEGLARAARILIRNREAEERVRIVEVERGAPTELFAAALPLLEVSYLGAFLPGQRPQRGAFAQAWVWLSYGFELLHAAMRADNSGASWSSRLAAVDLSGIDTPLSPLQDGAPGAEETCGSVFMTSALARRLLEHPDLPEPAYRAARDQLLRVWQSVPATVGGNWRRWVGQETAVLTSSRLRAGRGSALLYRRVWRPAFVWLAPAVLAAAGYQLAQAGSHASPSVLAPVAALLALYLVIPAVVRTAFAYALADRDLRSHRTWFIAYALAWILWLGAARNSAVRVAQMRLALGRRPRSVPAAAPAVVDLLPRSDAADVLRAPEAQPDQTAGGVEVQTPVKIESGLPTTRTEPLSPAAERVLRAADRLPAVIDVILCAIDRGAEECRELRERAKALEREAEEEEVRTATLRAYGSNTIDRAALASLREAMAELDAHPQDIAALAAVAQQAEPLARAVDGYVRLRSAALAE